MISVDSPFYRALGFVTDDFKPTTTTPQGVRRMLSALTSTHTREEGGEFFRIIPGKRKATLAPLPAPAIKAHLKVV